MKSLHLNKCFLALAVIFTSLNGCDCNPIKQPQEITPQKSLTNFSEAFTWSYYYDEKSHEIRVEINLKEGYHAYAEGEKIGRPINLLIEDFNGWQADGKPNLPKSPTQTLDHNFTIGTKVKGGKGALRGTLKMQLCSAAACDRPRDHHFEQIMPKEPKG